MVVLGPTKKLPKKRLEFCYLILNLYNNHVFKWFLIILCILMNPNTFLTQKLFFDSRVLSWSNDDIWLFRLDITSSIYRNIYKSRPLSTQPLMSWLEISDRCDVWHQYLQKEPANQLNYIFYRWCLELIQNFLTTLLTVFFYISGRASSGWMAS